MLAQAADAGILLNIGNRPIISTSPVTDTAVYCEPRTQECFPIIMRQNASYGRVFEILLNENQATNLVSNLYGQDLPDPINIYKVSAQEQKKIIDGATPLPPPGTLPPTDPEIGWKLLYCSASSFSCVGGIIGVFTKGAEAAFTFVGGCAGATKLCSDFKAAWDKERVYYEELQKYYRSIGYGPSGANTGGAGITGGQGGAGPGNAGTSEAVIEKCVGNTVGMGGGPRGEWLEESAVDCYPI